MAIITGILQLLQIKIPCILPCAELLATQIDRITAAVHCCLQALHGTRRGKQLRSIHSRHNSLLSLSCKPVVKEKSKPMKFSQMLHRHAAFRYFFPIFVNFVVISFLFYFFLRNGMSGASARCRCPPSPEYTHPACFPHSLSPFPLPPAYASIPARAPSCR